MQTSEWLINHDTPGIDSNTGGFLLYQPHVGERLVGALSGFEVLEAWDNPDPTHPPRLTVWAGLSGKPQSPTTPAVYRATCDLRTATGVTSSDLTTGLAGQPGSTDIRLIDPSPALGSDAVWQKMTNPLWVLIDDSFLGKPTSSHGSVLIRLTFQTSERHHG